MIGFVNLYILPCDVPSSKGSQGYSDPCCLYSVGYLHFHLHNCTNSCL